MVVSLFVTSEHGIVLQDNFAPNNKVTGLVGVSVPYFYFVKKVGAC